jgi:hypothetical protein
MSLPPELETEHRLTALETRLDVLLPTLATKADIAELKATIAEAKSSLLVWGITTAVAVVAILVALMLFLAYELQETPSDNSSLQPMVIHLPTSSVQTSPPAPSLSVRPQQRL